MSPDSIRYLASLFCYPVPLEELPETEQDHAIKVMRSLLSVQQVQLYTHIKIAAEPDYFPPEDEAGGTSGRGVQTVVMTSLTAGKWGDFDEFERVRNITGEGLRQMIRGDETSLIHIIHLRPWIIRYTKSKGGNVAYLVPPRGLTILSDIDDVLRETRIYAPEQGILNTFVRPYKPWMNMDRVFANWSSSIPDLHFHYMTPTPEQLARHYVQFLDQNYPGAPLTRTR